MVFNTDGASFKLRYGQSDVSEASEQFTTSSTAPLVFDFNNSYPTYFEFENGGEKKVDIASVNITLTCESYLSTLSVVSEDTAKGTVTGSASEVAPGTSMTVEATPATNYIFKGWYNESNELVSKENPYVFDMPNHNVSLTGKFWTEEEAQAAWNEEHGITPVIDTERKTVTYGLYPQTVVSDSALIDELSALADTSINTANGYYFLNNEYYVKATAAPYDSSAKFANGSAITSGAEYWFKCEAIEWRIITTNSDKHLLLTDKVIDNKVFYNSTLMRTVGEDSLRPNNYMYSEVRAWLNGLDGTDYSVTNYSGIGFFDKAFALNSNGISATTVDNSKDSFDNYSTSTASACANTEDKAFLLSYADFNNENYDISTYSEAMAEATDYALAMGAYKTTNSNTEFWTRSPRSSNASSAWYIAKDGALQSANVNTKGKGVRPSITLG